MCATYINFSMYFIGISFFMSGTPLHICHTFELVVGGRIYILGGGGGFGNRGFFFLNISFMFVSTMVLLLVDGGLYSVLFLFLFCSQSGVATLGIVLCAFV